MNIKKITESMNLLQEKVPRGLLHSSIVSFTDGQALVEFNRNPVADALMTQVSLHFKEAMTASRLGRLGDYYLVELNDNRVAICLMMEDYWWGLIIDKTMVSLGLLFNVIVPEIRRSFLAALQA